MNRTTTFQRDEPARVLVLTASKVVGEVINLTLNHGVYITRAAGNVAEATTLLEEWQPHLAIINVEVASDQSMKQIGAAPRQRCAPAGAGIDAQRRSQDQAGRV